ncbi:hypothetical protein Hanom_Chr08g00731201 [Helianthus anomalus]
MEGNFRLPLLKLLGEILTKYGIHLSQVNTLGLPRVTHFEFVCWAQKLVPTFEMFNVFYYVTYTGGFYSFNSRTEGVLPCSWDPPKSFHDWKQKFFYIRGGVIPIDMHYRAESKGVPKVVVVGLYADREWNKTLTKMPTPIIQLEGKVLVAAGMSLMWVPREPRATPLYAYKGKAGYSLLNVFDPKSGGEMTITPRFFL